MLLLFAALFWLLACEDSGSKNNQNNNVANNTNNTNNINNVNNVNNVNNAINNLNNTNNVNNNNNTCNPVAPVEPGARMAVLTAGTDNGALGELDVSGTAPVFRPDLLVAHSDATVRSGMGRVFVVGRMGGDSLLAADAASFAVQYQTPLEAGSNPQDVALVSTCKAYVSLYQRHALAVVNPATGEVLSTQVSLLDYADADGSPEAAWMEIVDADTVALAIQNLEDWVPSRTGRILLVDTATDVVTGEIELTSRNPFSPIVRAGASTFVVGCVDDFSGNQGGIEAFDTETLTSRLAVSAAELDGVPSDLVMENENCGFVLVNTPAWESGVRPFCLDGTVGDWIVPPGQYTMTGLAITDDARLVIADATASAAGLRLVDPAAPSDPAVFVSTPLPPGFAKPLAFLP